MSCQVTFPLQDIVLLLREKISPEIIGAVPEEKLEEEVLLFIQPKIDELQEQLNKLPPEVHISTQVLQGTELRTTLNNGTVLKSDLSPLFTRFDGLLALYDKNIQAGAGTDGWTAELIVDKSGATQQQINDTQEYRNNDLINARDWGVLSSNDAATNYKNMFALLNAFPERNGLNIFVPEGTYYFSKGFFITRTHKIWGIGTAERCRTIFRFDGAECVGTPNYKAAIFVAYPTVFQSGAGGGAVLPEGQVGNSGFDAVLENISVEYSPEHAIIKNIVSFCKGVAVKNNAKIGILTAASVYEQFSYYGGALSGIANSSTNTECFAINNGLDGFCEVGSDANVCSNINCTAYHNGRYGFYDGSLLGGTYINNQADYNTQGDYCQQGSANDISGHPATPATSLFIGNYCEGDRGSKNYATNGRSMVLMPKGGAGGVDLNGITASIAGLSLIGNVFTTPNGDANGAYLDVGGFADFTKLSPSGAVVMGWQDRPLVTKLGRINSNLLGILVSNVAGITWAIDSDINAAQQRGIPTFPSGLVLGSNNKHQVGSGVPTSGTFERGSVVWNTAPVAGGYVGWVATQQGTAGTLSGVTAQTTLGSNVVTVSSAASLKVGDYITFATAGGWIFRITDISGNTVTVNASVSQTAESNAVSFISPAFKGFGLIEA